MKFPKQFIAWIILLYNGAVSNVQNNGWLSQDIKLSHGVRQGCPYLCLLFNLVSQVLIYYLQFCGHFVSWLHRGNASSMYTDDIALVAENVCMLPGLIQDIEKCGEYTGLHLNLDKCVCFDPAAGADYFLVGVRVTSQPVQYLGAFVGIGPDVEHRNFEVPL